MSQKQQLPLNRFSPGSLDLPDIRTFNWQGFLVLPPARPPCGTLPGSVHNNLGYHFKCQRTKFLKSMFVLFCLKQLNGCN